MKHDRVGYYVSQAVAAVEAILVDPEQHVAAHAKSVDDDGVPHVCPHCLAEAIVFAVADTIYKLQTEEG